MGEALAGMKNALKYGGLALFGLACTIASCYGDLRRSVVSRGAR
jgi:hypothetical protein